MKRFAPISLLFAGVLLAGCSWHKSASRSAPKPPKADTTAAPTPKPIITPDTSLTARVVLYNDVGRFVILGFPVGHLPKAGASLFIYHNGLKVAQVTVNAMQSDTYVVADIINGDAQVGDEVRDQ